MQETVQKSFTLVIALLSFCVLFSPSLSFADGCVTNVENAKEKINEKSGAVVKFLATPEFQGVKSAFVAQLTVKAGSSVPEHRDTSDEFIYAISGSGTVWIDDKKSEVRPGSLIYMPANSKVKFKAGDKEDMVAIQMFAPPGPEKKYDSWKLVK